MMEMTFSFFKIMFRVRPRSLVNYFIAYTTLSYDRNNLRVYWYSKAIIL